VISAATKKTDAEMWNFVASPKLSMHRPARKGASNLIIGGIVPGETNLISVYISGISMHDSSSVTIWGNFIGTDFSGSTAIPDQSGISMQNSNGVLIGGTAPVRALWSRALLQYPPRRIWSSHSSIPPY